jgi:hypothetical protein
MGQSMMRGNRLTQIDDALDGELTTEELNQFKDELLTMISKDPQAQVFASARLARIKMRLKEVAALNVRTVTEQAQKKQFHLLFYESANRLLDPTVFEMLLRDTKVKQAEVTLQEGITAKVETVSKSLNKQTKIKASNSIPESLSAPIHRLVVSAQNKPLKFDPTSLFKEFGRERVLATWNMLPAEKRPETAHEFRLILQYGVPS